VESAVCALSRMWVLRACSVLGSSSNALQPKVKDVVGAAYTEQGGDSRFAWG
jgi:hypothetical protein